MLVGTGDVGRLQMVMQACLFYGCVTKMQKTRDLVNTEGDRLH